MIKIQTPQNDETVSLRTAEQNTFFEIRHKRFVAKQFADVPLIDEREKLDLDYSIPAPVKLSWNDDDNNGCSLYKITVSQNKDLRDPVIKYTNAQSFDLYNLCIGTKYYWTVQKDNIVSEICSFETALLTPRFIKVDGVTNVRDIGGYSVPGGRIRQQMLYRGARVADITDDGIKTLHSLGIKNELELRFEHAHDYDHSVLEQHGITLRKYPIHAYGGCFSDPAKPSIKELFTLLADESNYPIYFHCAAGADRTGSVAFLIEAILGVYYKDMRDDYEITSMSRGGIRFRSEPGAVDGLAALEELCIGQTWQELCTDFLVRLVGVPESTINKVREILIEKI